jgi:PAS domain S-box-containing protein
VSAAARQPRAWSSTRVGSRRARREQVFALVEAVQRLSLARELDEVQAIVRKAGRALAGADGATFVLRDDDHCFYADEDAIAPLWKGQRFPIETCISGWVMLNREAAVIEDIYVDSRIPHDAYRPTFVKSLAMVPIRTLDPIGAIGNYWAERHRPGDEELELLQALADSTAVALENIRVYRELEQRAHATAAFTFVSDGVVLVDTDGVVLSWNPAAARITGLRRDETVGRRIEEALPAWADIASRIPLVDAAETGGPVRESLPLPIAGEERWLAISGTTFSGGTVYAFHDVSAEQALDRMRSELVATVSHELRTPLAAVYGAAATLEERGAALAEPDRVQLVEMIATQASRLRSILEEILLATQLETGTLALSIERVDLGRLTDEVAASMRAAHPGTEIVVKAANDATPVDVDVEKVCQVLRNLIENAIRYSKGSPHVALTATSDGRRLRFAVADRGVGIPSGELGRVFEKFYRVDSEMVGGVGGTGLGLYICRELVEQMGGRLSVESEVGRGSTFSFDVPLPV